ncbi:MAG: hypothetical protein KDK36_05720, partial [Leptospiraceae bacterium]|nr:hypothetical protein [Leptospiraceae bacterium]
MEINDNDKDFSLMEFIFQVSPIGFLIIDKTGFILRSNPFIENLFEIELNSPYDSKYIYDFEIFKKVNFIDKFNECISTMGPIASECSFFNKNGKRRHVEYYFLPIHAPFENIIIQSVVIDLTSRKEEQEEVKKISQYFHSLLSGLSPVATLDDNFKVKFANEPFLSELFEEPFSPIGKNFLEILEINNKEKKELEKNLKLSAKEKIQNYEFSVGDKIFGYSIFRFENDIGIILKNITDTRNLERKIEELYSMLLKSQERERENISRDLHDSVGQTILAAKLNLMAFWKDPDLPEEKFQYALSLIDNTSQELREIYTNLYPSVLNELGIEAAVRSLIRGMFGDTISVELNYHIERKLPHELDITIYRILQEICSNAVKHSGATSFYLNIIEQGKEIILTAIDNGKGISNSRSKGFGLQNMKRRVEDLGGEIELESKKNKGLKINI